MRPKGIEYKEVFYVTRVKDTINGSYFRFSNSRVVFNPNNRFEFYLKIGGIVYAKMKKVSGSKKSSATERFLETENFGSYLYYSDSDLKLRTITYCRRIGLPERKLISGIGILHSVIPRFSGSKGKAIIGMVLDQSQNTKRKWTRFDGLKKNLIRKGYTEFFENVNYSLLIKSGLRFENERFGFYVGQNTSLLMIDETSQHLHNDLLRNYNYTLFQAGALVIIKYRLSFKFYDTEESDLFSCQQMLQNKSHLMPSTIDFHLICGNKPIFFLKSAPNYTFWTLRMVSARRNQQNGRNVQLGIPTGGQFERVFNWETGIEEVVRRQRLEPWNRYISLDKDSNFEDIDLEVSEAYPGINLNTT